ncbi:DUF2589 domain-containing protein [Thalassotalea nanhaiensis]|uniref:DUF2589 domain-containing protein n=1 Tax=Thalassotalea nanhaiensis TaxID=3065648 RepID=A0ABY9TM85_9GAMM|nr:DUF2589 domain-containing protein [Colwelliaceae bacterium SQ345]
MATKSLDDLVEAITGAVVHARELLEAQHVDVMHRFFKDSNGDGKLEALTQTIQIPNTHTESKDDYVEVEVPLFSLVPLNSLKLDEVEIAFDANISSLEDSDKSLAPGLFGLLKSRNVKEDESRGRRKRMHLDMAGNGLLGNKKNNTNIKITLKGTDPPEGLIRVNNHVLKQIP